jgi:hypothetical protein
MAKVLPAQTMKINKSSTKGNLDIQYEDDQDLYTLTIRVKTAIHLRNKLNEFFHEHPLMLHHIKDKD